MKIKTSRFGEIEIDSGKIIFMPEGVLGFPGCKRYILLDGSNNGPFIWLQAVDDPDLAFIVMDPLALDEGFHVPVYPKDLSALKARSRDDLSFLVIVSVHREDPPCIVVNLQGPLAINHKAFIARQIVLSEKETPKLSGRRPLAAAASATG